MNEPQGRALVPDRTFGALVPTIAILAGVIATFGLWRHNPTACVNPASRWDTVYSLVEHGTYVIGTDEAPEPFFTIDKVKRDGRYYSSKPALYPTLLAKDYWIIRKLTGWTLPDKIGPISRIILLKWNILLFVALVWLYGKFLNRHVSDPWVKGFWLIAAAFGTYTLGYNVTLNDHSVAITSVFFAAYFLVRILYDGEHRWYYYAMIGACTVWATTNGMAAALMLVGCFAILALTGDRKTWTCALPAALLVGAAFMVTTYLSTGGFIPYYFLRHTELYEYAGGYWDAPTGIDALEEPKWLYFLHGAIGHHGVFSLTPIYIFAFIPMGLFLARKTKAMPHLMWLTIACTILAWGAYVVNTNNYGGGCKGFRWLFWLSPLWLMVAPIGAQVWARHVSGKVLAYAALAVSLVSSFDAWMEPWGSSWLHQLFSKWKWIAY